MHVCGGQLSSYAYPTCHAFVFLWKQNASMQRAVRRASVVLSAGRTELDRLLGHAVLLCSHCPQQEVAFLGGGYFATGPRTADLQWFSALI